MSNRRNDRCREAGRAKLPVFLCPKCHKKHYGAYPSMDEFINCECGFRFYVFIDHDLSIMMKAEEAMYEPIAQAMRRFVVKTGRCRNIDPILLGNTDQIPYLNMQEQDLDDELARLLKKYQLEVHGKSYITRNMIDSICWYFNRNTDVVLNKQKDGVDIREQSKPTRILNEDASSSAKLLTYNERFRGSQKLDMPVTGGIMWNPQISEAQMAGQ